MFCRKIENTKQNKFENRNEIKNKKYNNGQQIELGQMIKLKTNGKIWERIQKESKNIGKTATDTHVWIFRFFRCSTPIPDCLSFDFSFIVFQIFELRFPISIFRFLVHSEFMFQFFICRSVYFRFQKFDFRFPVFGLRRFRRFVYFRFQKFDFRFPVFGSRRFDTFTKRVSFCVFSTFRFHIYSFLIFDVHFSNFRCPQRNARRGALLPKKTNGTSSNEPKTFGTYFKRYCTRHVAHVPWVPNLFSL